MKSQMRINLCLLPTDNTKKSPLAVTGVEYVDSIELLNDIEVAEMAPKLVLLPLDQLALLAFTVVYVVPHAALFEFNNVVL